MIEAALDEYLNSTATLLTAKSRREVIKGVIDEVLGYGPIQPLLDDNDITEVMVNGPLRVYVERFGKITRSDRTFRNDGHVLRIIEKIVAPIGRRVDESSPMVDARLPAR